MSKCKSCTLYSAVYTCGSIRSCFRVLHEIYFQNYLKIKNSYGDAIFICAIYSAPGLLSPTTSKGSQSL